MLCCYLDISTHDRIMHMRWSRKKKLSVRLSVCPCVVCPSVRLSVSPSVRLSLSLFPPPLHLTLLYLRLALVLLLLRLPRTAIDRYIYIIIYIISDISVHFESVTFLLFLCDFCRNRHFGILCGKNIITSYKTGQKMPVKW